MDGTSLEERVWRLKLGAEGVYDEKYLVVTTNTGLRSIYAARWSEMDN